MYPLTNVPQREKLANLQYFRYFGRPESNLIVFPDTKEALALKRIYMASLSPISNNPQDQDEQDKEERDDRTRDALLALLLGMSLKIKKRVITSIKSDQRSKYIQLETEPFSPGQPPSNYITLHKTLSKSALEAPSSKLSLHKNIFIPNEERDYIKQAIDENVTLIKTLETQYLDKIKDILYKISQGGDADLLHAELRKISILTPEKANFIANDQIRKLTAKLAMFNHLDLGLTQYRWRTKEDDRVRPSHRKNNGKVFDYRFPPETGNPGDDYGCRCVAEPLNKL